MEALVVVWLLCACVTAVIVNAKTNESGKVVLYFIIGLVFGIFGILLAIAAPDEKKQALAAGNVSQPQRSCPLCRELILADAIKCKHCGERLDRMYEKV